MKNRFPFPRLLLALLVLLPGAAAKPAAAAIPATTAGCKPLDAYRVEGLDFQRLDARRALQSVLAGTPYGVVFRGRVPDKRVTAQGVTGSVAEVLPELMDQLGLAYTISDCTLAATSAAAPVFSLKKGEELDAALEHWLRERGYTLYWDAPHFSAGAGLRIAADVKEVMQSVVQVLAGNGIAVRVEIYENDVVRVVEAK